MPRKLQFNHLKYFFPIFVILLMISSANGRSSSSSKSSSSVNSQIDNEYLVKYFNSFETLGGLIDGMQFSGFLNSEDHQEILLKLKEMGVDPKAKLSLMKAEGNSIRFGKTAVLIFDSNGKTKTGDGHFINLKKDATITDAFLQTVHLQTGKKVGFLPSLFLNPAWADVVDKMDAVESGLGFVAKHVGGLVFGDIVSPIAGTVAGVVGGGINFTTWAIRTWLEKGTVKCQAGEYVAVGFQDGGRSPLEIFNGEKEAEFEDIERFCSDENRSSADMLKAFFLGHSRIICKVSVTGELYFKESFEKREKSFYSIKSAVLKKEIGDPVPRCTPELASMLNDKLKARLRAGIDAVKQGKASRLVHPSSSEDHNGVH
ncbi:MAG: hypothetical protein ACXVCY_09340 [Pseudobdellovibrionaceae bacterium]